MRGSQFKTRRDGCSAGRILTLTLAVACVGLAAVASPAAAGNVPDGEQAGYTTSGSLEQVVAVSPGDVCTFSMWVGKRSDGAGVWGRWFVQLTTGGWNVQNVMNGSLPAQADEWVEYQTTFTVGSFPNLPIKLRLKGQWGFEVYDLVALDCGGGDLVSNGSFESPLVADGTWTTFGNPAPDDWTTVGGGAGLFNPNTTQMADFGAPTGTARLTNGGFVNVEYHECGADGQPGNCSAAAAQQACQDVGMKVVSHASDGSSTVFDLGATVSCWWSISYFTVDQQMNAGDCLVGISNLQWSGCCSQTLWHGNTVPFGAPGQTFGFVEDNPLNSGYVSTNPNVSGLTWGCQLLTSAAQDMGCTKNFVACTP